MNPTVLSLFDIDPFRVGGVEMFARELSAQLAERGWRSVLCFAGPPVEAVRRYLDLPNVALEVLPNPSRRAWQPLRDFMRILRRHRPAILHLQFTPLLSPYPWLARLQGVKGTFFTDHSSRPEHYVPRRAAFWKRLMARAINFPITGVTSVSDYNRQCLEATGFVPAQRLRRIYDAVDVSRGSVNGRRSLDFRRKHSIPPESQLVVQVSWIRPEKGLLDLVEAARLVLARNPDVRFAFVGEGAWREEYRRKTAEMGLADRVFWTGVVTDPLAQGVYAAADVVCQVSRWQEAFGWTIAEAMSSRKPVVATRVGAIPELVENGETGFFVPPRDAAAIAEKITLLLADRGLRERMGVAGRKAVESSFNVKTNVAELVNHYGID